MGMFSSSPFLNMKIFVAIAFFVAVAECRRHLCDDGKRPVCPDGSKAVYNRPTGKNTDGSKYFPPQCVVGKERQPVQMDQRPGSGSTSANQMIRNAPKDKDKVLQTSLSKSVLMDLSVNAQGVERAASSTTGGAPMGRNAITSVRVVYHTAHGSPRTGTSMMESGSTTLGTTDLGIRDTTGDLPMMETSLKHRYLITYLV